MSPIKFILRSPYSKRVWLFIAFYFLMFPLLRFRGEIYLYSEISEGVYLKSWSEIRSSGLYLKQQQDMVLVSISSNKHMQKVVENFRSEIAMLHRGEKLSITCIRSNYKRNCFPVRISTPIKDIFVMDVESGYEVVSSDSRRIFIMSAVASFSALLIFLVEIFFYFKTINYGRIDK